MTFFLVFFPFLFLTSLYYIVIFYIVIYCYFSCIFFIYTRFPFLFLFLLLFYDFFLVFFFLFFSLHRCFFLLFLFLIFAFFSLSFYFAVSFFFIIPFLLLFLSSIFSYMSLSFMNIWPNIHHITHQSWTHTQFCILNTFYKWHNIKWKRNIKGKLFFFCSNRRLPSWFSECGWTVFSLFKRNPYLEPCQKSVYIPLFRPQLDTWPQRSGKCHLPVPVTYLGFMFDYFRSSCCSVLNWLPRICVYCRPTCYIVGTGHLGFILNVIGLSITVLELVTWVLYVL